MHAPIERLSDALGDLARAEHRAQQLGVDASTAPRVRAAPSTADWRTSRSASITQNGCTLASLRNAARQIDKKHDPQAQLHRAGGRPRADAVDAPATRFKDSATTGDDEPDPKVEQVQAPDDRKR